MDRTPDDETQEMQEQAVAEAIGVTSETIEVPPGIVRGITLFELEDGSFGFLPTTDGTTLMDAYMLCSRIMVGINADIIAQRTLQAQRQVIAKAKQTQAEKDKKPQLFLPQVGVRKS